MKTLPINAEFRATIERWNESARIGKDPDFGKGERANDRFYGDPAVKPNPSVGAVEKAPFYAIAFYPGDVGTCGGLVTDADGRVRSSSGVIEGLYATGNCTAPVTGRTYPGPGTSIANSMVFAWRAVRRMVVESVADQSPRA